MNNRPGRTSRRASVTSPARLGLLTCGFTLATLTVATLNTSVAAAEPIVRCRTLEGGGDYTCITETPTAPATTGSTGSSSSGAGLGDWFSEHVGTVMFVIAVAAVIAIVAMVTSGTSKDKAAASEAELARGRQIAMDAGVEPAAQSPEDLRRYSAFQWAAPWKHGTAFGTLVDRDGGTSRVHAAWTEACELARLGHWDESGKFTPAATVVNVNGYHDDNTGDLELSVSTRDYTVGDRELDRVREHLVRTARVETASAWTRNATRDWYVTRLSMIPKQQQAAAPEQTAAPDPTTAWEW
ncbi:hypothetical protein [Mycobacteroides abscessus]|uniref:hypothetical protein n=1 Tax=Mycobacteroides abscessus TaxID=36809 RepID=UPI0020C2FA57|nr:hypothetical protein [Mycobacteroides abscessus]